MFLDGGPRSLVAAGTKSFSVRNGVVEARGVDLGIQQGDRLQRGCSDEGLGLAPADSDGDGILDKWEDRKGIDYDGDGNIDLILPPGVSKTRPDVLVYVDWGRGAKFTREEISDLRYAFLINGVGLHIVEGKEIVLPPEGKDGNGDELLTEVNSLGVVARLKAANAFKSLGTSPIVREAALLVFHYGILTKKGGGKGEIWGDEFAAGNRSKNESRWNKDRNRAVQAGTFMHELGHNLGLMHGGLLDHTYVKPNHFSVMNYIYQNDWLPYGLGLTYSHGNGNGLDERSLNERTGVSTSDESDGLRSKINGKQIAVGVPLNYNKSWWFDSNKSELGVTKDINILTGSRYKDYKTKKPWKRGPELPGSFDSEGDDRIDEGNDLSKLNDSDEWAALRYCFRGSGSYAAFGLSNESEDDVAEDDAPTWDPNPMIAILPDGRAYLIDDIDGDGKFDPEIDGPIVRQEFQMTLPNGDIITLRTDDYGAIIPTDELVATPESGVTVELTGEGWTFGQEPAVVVQERTGPDGGEPVFGEAPPTTPPSTSVLSPSKDPVATTTTSAKPGSGPSASEPAPSTNAVPSSSDNAAPGSSDNAAPPVATSKPVAAQPKAPQPKSAPVREAAASPNTGSGPLARTGSSTSLLLGLALAVGLSGVALVAGSRRRRQ